MTGFMLVQIYEIQDRHEAKALVDLGVDHIGVLVGDGDFPRELDISRAREIFEAVGTRAQKVALSLAGSTEKIRRVVSGLEPDILHLGAAPDLLGVEPILRLRKAFPDVRIMRSIPVTGEESVALARQYEMVADFLLLDSHDKDDDQIGATGQVHDWSISRRIVESVRIPCILAGGLGPENVAEAIRSVRPAGVDSKTRTDRGDGPPKDLEKVKAFVKAARG